MNKEELEAFARIVRGRRLPRIRPYQPQLRFTGDAVETISRNWTCRRLPPRASPLRVRLLSINSQLTHGYAYAYRLAS